MHFSTTSSITSELLGGRRHTWFITGTSGTHYEYGQPQTLTVSVLGPPKPEDGGNFSDTIVLGALEHVVDQSNSAKRQSRYSTLVAYLLELLDYSSTVSEPNNPTSEAEFRTPRWRAEEIADVSELCPSAVISESRGNFRGPPSTPATAQGLYLIEPDRPHLPPPS